MIKQSADNQLMFSIELKGSFCSTHVGFVKSFSYVDILNNILKYEVSFDVKEMDTIIVSVMKSYIMNA